MSSSTVSAYTTAAGDLPDEYFLGQVVSFTITEADVNLDDMRAELAARNLRPDTLKKRLRPVDAFKKAANDVATKFAKRNDEQHSLLVRPVGQDSAESHRHVVFERAVFKTGQRRRVEHETVWKLIYDRGRRDRQGNITDDAIYAEEQVLVGVALEPEEQTWLDTHIGHDGARLRERYEHYRTHLDSHGVRAFVREYLYLLGATNIKSNGGGGLYFVPQKHASEVRDLMDLVKSIGSDMHLIPLLDIVEQRDMLAEAFVAETMDEIRATTVEINKILGDPSRTITDGTFDQYAAKAAALITKAKDYQTMLDTTLDHANLELQVFQTNTLSLASRIRKPKSMSQPVAP